ncbi:hypothetical protein BC835DRAFT_1326028 [Cytidiella melzeri]|nr:hypothetical protein BC835DRAFT_1326028 [Cytidiella melzeri]
MPVFDGGFAVVNALARSLGLESGPPTPRKGVESTPVTRTSSAESDTTVVDTEEVVLKIASKGHDGDDSAGTGVVEIVDLEHINETVIASQAQDNVQVDAQQDSPAGPTEKLEEVKPACKDAPPTLRVRRGLIEPFGISAPATYADATNLATQFPEHKEAILALPLSPTRLEPQVVHTPSRPNWALAPDEPCTPPAREEVGNRSGRRARGARKGRGGADMPSRPETRTSSPTPRAESKQPHQTRSRPPSQSPKKKHSVAHERMPSAEIIIAPSPTYICLPAGSSVVVADGRPPSNGAPAVVDVDALTRELQKAQGLGSAGFSSTSRASTPDKFVPSNNLPQVSETTTVATELRGRVGWGSGVALGPGIAADKIEKTDRASSLAPIPASQAYFGASLSRRCTPSPLRQAQTVKEMLESDRERSRSRTTTSGPSRVETPTAAERVREGKATTSTQVKAALLPAHELRVPQAAEPTVVTPVIIDSPPIVRLQSLANATVNPPKASVLQRPSTISGTRQHWPTLDEVIAFRSHSASTSGHGL